MRRAAVAALAVFVSSASIASAPSAGSDADPRQARFATIDVILDADQPVAAYQVEITVRRGDSSIVGVEGGEAPFEEPPYYDPAALTRGRIILASFDTRATIAAGRHRVASLHVREVGDAAEYDIQLTVAADIDGRRGAATAALEARKETP